ncbi:hypothetical protein QPK77_04330 [Providencia rettgeri]|uniref:Uncharacterized protein n=4 Tax=Providencia TaxID=586 RepID=A0ABT9AMA6_9GAMM|nr:MULTISPECIES: hypothetical protein [Providencia]MDK3007193.1 hypothetical protein [Providencia rettgeri]MDL9982581.1 hypothetical protein [Providencia rettgeri]MDO7830686.1 hypothetical protein [Providencia sp. CRE-138-0026]MDO7855713.1 hypothetical protein [Providencia sp. CRE-138-0111]
MSISRLSDALNKIQRLAEAALSLSNQRDEAELKIQLIEIISKTAEEAVSEGEAWASLFH